jgi:hypothetical protein
MKSDFSIVGHITVEARDAKTGELVFRESKKNTIVNGVKTVVERLLQQSVGTYADYNKIWALYVGGTAGLMQLEMNLLSGEANGNTLREVAIYTRGDDDDPTVAAGQTMVARQVHGDLAKSSGITIKYIWDLQVTT